VFHSRQGQEILPFSIESRPALRPVQSPLQRVRGAPSLRVRGPGHEADHSLPSSDDVNNGAAILSLPIRLHGVVKR
jgi:hypothetical protein